MGKSPQDRKSSSMERDALVKRSLSIQRDAYASNQKALLFEKTAYKIHESRELLRAEIKERKKVEAELRQAYSIIEEDLRSAAELQRMLLPEPAMLEGYGFDWLYRPSNFIGGDSFNYFRLDDDHIGLYILDVSGHGIPAALLSFTISRTLLPFPEESSFLKKYNFESEDYEIMAPSLALKELNKRFHKSGGPVHFFTMIYATIELSTGRVSLLRAGHEKPIYLPKNGEAVFLEEGGLPLGVLGDIDYEGEEVIEMGEGDRLFLYTDGIVECARHPHNEKEFYSKERLLKLVEKSRELPIDEVLKKLEKTLTIWRASTEFSDDITMLVLEKRADR